MNTSRRPLHHHTPVLPLFGIFLFLSVFCFDVPAQAERGDQTRDLPSAQSQTPGALERANRSDAQDAGARGDAEPAASGERKKLSPAIFTKGVTPLFFAMLVVFGVFTLTISMARGSRRGLIANGAVMLVLAVLQLGVFAGMDAAAEGNLTTDDYGAYSKYATLLIAILALIYSGVGANVFTEGLLMPTRRTSEPQD